MADAHRSVRFLVLAGSALILFSLASIAIPAPHLQARAFAADTSATRPEDVGAPVTVMFWNRPIVVMRATAWGLTADRRAATAEERLGALPHDLKPEEIASATVERDGEHGVMYLARGRALFTLFEDDLDPTVGDRLDSASAVVLRALSGAVSARAEESRPMALAKSVALALGATLLLVLFLKLIVRLTGFIHLRLNRVVQDRTSKALGSEVAGRVGKAEHAAFMLGLWALRIAATYMWLTYVLQRFAYTRPWGLELGGYLAALVKTMLLGAVNALPGLFAILLIVIAARLIVQLVGLLFLEIERGAITVPGIHPDTARATRQVCSILIWILALSVSYPYIPGSGTDAFKAIGVFSGLMISLGSSGLVNQVMSGLLVIYSRSLRTGEFINSGEVTGVVKEIGLIATKIATMGREEVTIPNAVLMSAIVTNYSRMADERGAMIGTKVTIGYDASWRQVHAMMLLAWERTSTTLKEPKPFVLQRALSDFYVEYEIRGFIERAETRFIVLSELHANIQDQFNEHGVQIMSPAFESQPEKAVVVPKDQWYAAPGSPDVRGAPPLPPPIRFDDKKS